MYLVTGGAGFIGSHTVRTLLGQGADVRVLDDLSTGNIENLQGLDVDVHVGSIEDPSAVRRSLDGVTRVIHLAAKISVPESWERPTAYQATNVGAFVGLMEASVAAGVKALVYASSCAVYGSLPGLPKREDAPLAPESPYAASKAADEMFARCMGGGDELQAVGLRYFNVFGPRQDPQGPYGAVIPKFVERALRGESLIIHGDGEQARDFVSVRDVARANVAASQASGVAGRVFNVGGGRMTSINQLADVVAAAVPGPVSREYGPARRGDVRFSMADISAAEQALGWAPRDDFDAALRETVEWFLSQHS